MSEENVAIARRGYDAYNKDGPYAIIEFEEARIEPLEFIEADDQVVVPFVFTARTRESGIQLSERWAHIWTIKNGKGVRLDQYTDPANALAAAGLSE